MNGGLIAMRLTELFRQARSKNASDVHVVPGAQPVLRIDGRLETAGAAMKPADCEALADHLLDEDQRRELKQSGDVTAAWRSQELGSYRVHAYRCAHGLSLSARLLALSVPPLESLRLPHAVSAFAAHHHGLVLFAGPTGSGKTTALASLADLINRNDRRHIITIEDPIEYPHTPVQSVITQREVGRDAATFESALRGALRSDPDVIVLGEMRDAQTMRAALTAAETGHLVFATVHTGDAPQTIDRIVDAFSAEAQNQVRAQLAQTLLGVVCLRLVPRATRSGRAAAAEVLLANDAVRNLIRERKTHQLRNVIGTCRQLGMQTLETHLSELVMRREITLQAALAATSRPHEVRSSERSAV